MAEALRRPRTAHKRKKRLGCGTGSGKGKTCGRGHKGAGQRSGKEHGPKFEGGQMPLARRIPKRGMQKGKKINRMHRPKGRGRYSYQIINLTTLADWDPSEPVNPQTLKQKGIIRKADRPIKLLARGEIKKPLNITVDAASAKAREAVEAAGGKLEVAS
ncbi:50S ribosomal protein L15 [candidate division WOR-3 bacterium]|uniref:Large ribosomal subunit protein uL15 n=1 Tax=candidate division WOR-3 bacterium TaxID=2052148 RepID=A0A9D5QBN7_UNCW3|nr:50S ribosomal protein L15 [candidate division WOR-3 bacterium]MBD3363793.1 50S ribosomal protein L15 [candidate division WOR-3 bacterium]